MVYCCNFIAVRFVTKYGGKYGAQARTNTRAPTNVHVRMYMYT